MKVKTICSQEFIRLLFDIHKVMSKALDSRGINDLIHARLHFVALNGRDECGA